MLPVEPVLAQSGTFHLSLTQSSWPPSLEFKGHCSASLGFKIAPPKGARTSMLLTFSLGITMGKGMTPRDSCGVRRCHYRVDTAATVDVSIVA